MSKIKKKYILLGTGANELNGRDIPANLTPDFYTPTEVASEGIDKISAHLKGIDIALGASQSLLGSFSYANNTVAAADVIGLLLTGRSAKILIKIELDATADLFETRELVANKKSATWELADINGLGDQTNVVFSITSGGQIQYTSPNASGFVAGTFYYRTIEL